MRIPLPLCVPFEIVGHRPGPPVERTGSNDINPSTLRNNLPIKLRRIAHPTWANENDSRRSSATSNNASAAQVQTTAMENTPAENRSRNLRALKNWVNAGPFAERSQRREIEKKFTRCWNNPNETELCINSMQRLTSLPPIPPTVTQLQVANCGSLGSPPILQEGSQLETVFFIACRHLRNVPDVSVCAELKTLHIEGCDQITDPPDLSGCRHLTQMKFFDCARLAALPDLAACPELRVLNLTNCHALATSLNLSPCPQLKVLSINGCRGITALALAGCDQLETVYAQDCASLQTLPSVGHLQHLTAMHLQSTALTSLPDDIVRLPRTCVVNFDASRLSDAVRTRLAHVMNAPGYTGPRINYSLGQPLAGATAQPLHEEVAAWRSEAPAALQQALTGFDWRRLPQHDNAAAFSTFLARVRETSDYRHPSPALKAATQQRVARLLEQLQADPVLREDCFNLALDAVNTCGDRVALRLMDMENLAVTSTASAAIDAGKYDNSPHALVDLCKGQHRLAIIAAAADSKVAHMHFTDPIEVHLGYITKLAEPCQLPVQISTMLYLAHAGVTDEDLAAVRTKLSNAGLPGTECAANNLAYQAALAGSPLIRTLLARLRPTEIREANAGTNERILKAQEQIREQMDALNPARRNFQQKNRQLMAAYHAVKTDIPVRATMPVLTSFYWPTALTAVLTTRHRGLMRRLEFARKNLAYVAS